MARAPWFDAPEDDEQELLGLWLSRLMFGHLMPAEFGSRYVETRSFEEFARAANSHSRGDE